MEQRKWYDYLSLRGYTQFRFNPQLGGDALQAPGDRFLGNAKGFGIRRSRLAISADLHPLLSVYVQPDFASMPSGSATGHFVQLRDAYADVYLNKARTFRFRVGQSKVPYGWENLQSSQNRLALDRNDALNTAVRDERDIGIFFYYTSSPIRARFQDLIVSGLRGSGDYGLVGFGVYSGQGANRSKDSTARHVVARITYPFQFANGQYLEAGASAYSGRFAVPRTSAIAWDERTVIPVDDFSARGRNDQRIAAHVVYYPQPFGVQAEWTFGRGPQLGVDNARITRRRLHGGYVQVMYRLQSPTAGAVIPYAKWQTYRGASKFDTNNPAMRVDEIEIGARLQPFRTLELTAAYARMKRTNVARPPYRTVRGDFLRMQLQVNY